jgi:trehalose 6-phosphate phosphatase
MSDLLSPDMESEVAALARPGTLILLDFDGTLAPIVGDRNAAGMSGHTRAVLRRLAGLYPVAVLSGRAAEDVRRRLEGIDVRWVVGSHGAEWPGEGREHRAWRSLVSGWRSSLEGRLANVKGVELEVKPLSLAVHFRHSADPDGAAELIQEAIQDLPGVAVVLGKKVVNLLPEGAGDKGTALKRLVGLSGAERILFIGDDVTDEAAFGTKLDIPALMVRVGRSAKSLAGGWLRRRSDVDVLLDRVCQLRETAGPIDPGAAPKGPVVDVEAELLGPALAFMRELWALEQGLNQRSKAMLIRNGVTGPQRLVVRVVGRLGPISPAQLARVLHLHPSSVTRLIRRLEARSFIRRIPHPTHRGRFVLSLGPRGGRVERLDPGTVESAVKAALRAAGPRDVAATRRVLALVTSRLAAKP